MPDPQDSTIARRDFVEYYLALYGDGNGQGWLEAKAAIGRLAQRCRSSEMELLVASLPELHDVEQYAFGRITELVAEAARENGAAFVDLRPYLEGQEPSSLWVAASDPHPNSRANELIAAGLFEAVLGMVPSSKLTARAEARGAPENAGSGQLQP